MNKKNKGVKIILSKKIIVIEGYLASGKSTFAMRLSKETGVPYLIKDTFKTALCESIIIDNRKESSRFSAVTFDAMMYVVERMFERGYPLIIEGNFVPCGIKKVDEAGAIKQLVCQYGYKSLTYHFTGNTYILHNRFIEREKTPERGRANVIGEPVPYEDFEQWCHNLDCFDIGGEIIRVDTTDFKTVDFNKLLESGRQFILSEENSASISDLYGCQQN